MCDRYFCKFKCRQLAVFLTVRDSSVFMGGKCRVTMQLIMMVALFYMAVKHYK